MNRQDTQTDSERVRFESVMFEETERPGEAIFTDDIDLISHRYYKAMTHCEDKLVLEVGAGSNLGKEEIIALSKKYVGIDVSEENLKQLRTRGYGREVSFFNMDAHNMNFESGSFDVVIALAMIYYLNSDKFLPEVKRILKPGGVLFFCTSNKEVPGFVESPSTTEYFNVNEWDGILSEQGFSSQFEGAFKRGSNSFSLRLFAFLKQISKVIVLKFLSGADLWQKLRGSYKGEKMIIPDKLEKFPECKENSVVLDPKKIDKMHRVIYCLAKKAN